MSNNNDWRQKYFKYKKKYLYLKQQYGGVVDNSLFFHVDVSTITTAHKENLIKKFNIEQNIAEQFVEFYKFMGYFCGLLGKVDENVSYGEILNFSQHLDVHIKLETNDFSNYSQFITYLKTIETSEISDFILDFKNKIEKIKFDKNKIINIDAFRIGIDIENKLRELNGYLKDFEKRGMEPGIRSGIMNLIRKIIQINPLEILHKILNIYSSNYTILQITPKSNELNIPLIEPSNLSIECIFNKISANKKDCKKKSNMFASMGEATLKFYESLLNKQIVENMKRYLVSYNDQIYMFVNTGNPTGDRNLTISEHIYITKTPSNYISNLYENKDEKEISVKLHLYSLNLCKPNYIYSHPLDIMKDIFQTNFVAKNLFSKCPDVEIFGFSSSSLGFGIYPTVKYSVNHQILNEMLNQNGF